MKKTINRNASTMAGILSIYCFGLIQNIRIENKANGMIEKRIIFFSFSLTNKVCINNEMIVNSTIWKIRKKIL